MPKGTFELKKAANGTYHFVLKASNGQVIAQSQTYKSKATAMNGIESVKAHAADANFVDNSDKPAAAKA